MPRPSLGRRRIDVRLLPEAIEALGPSPSQCARRLIESLAAGEWELYRGDDFLTLKRWAKTQPPADRRVDGQAVEGSAAKLGPGRSEVDAETEVTNTTRRR